MRLYECKIMAGQAFVHNLKRDDKPQKITSFTEEEFVFIRDRNQDPRGLIRYADEGVILMYGFAFELISFHPLEYLQDNVEVDITLPDDKWLCNLAVAYFADI